MNGHLVALDSEVIKIYAQLKSPYPNSQVKMAELVECESSQDRKMQGTCTEGSVCTNDITSSDSVKIIGIRTKVSVCMSDVTTSNIVQDKNSSHVTLESNQHGKTLAYQA